MASTIQIKRNTSEGQTPQSLAAGELAVNVFDRKLYVGNIKNNINTKAKKEDRRVFPMDLLARKNLGQNLRSSDKPWSIAFEILFKNFWIDAALVG